MRTKVILAALALAYAAPADAEDCAPLKIIASVDLIPAPGGVRMLVPVTINNIPKQFLLNTGSGFTTLTRATVDGLHLHAVDGSRIRLLDSAGNASRKYAYVDNLQLGNLVDKDTPFLITPDPNAGQDVAFDGVLGGDFMAPYDVEFDFAARKMYFFSHDHCAGHVVHWPATAIAMVPFHREPLPPSVPGERTRIRILPDTHIRVPVTVDGKEFLATINTGAVRSTMDAETAKRVFDVTEQSPGSVPLGLVDHDPNHRVFGHIFNSLTFDGITVTNAHIAVIPHLLGSKDPDNTITTGSRIQKVDDGIGPEVTIGMDVLKHLHLYAAFDERKLYMTAASAPTDAANPPNAAKGEGGAQ